MIDEDLMRDVYMTKAQRETYERLLKDAERYRWLRKEHASDGPSYHVRRPSNCPAPHDLDADLDAAMTA